MNKIVRHHYLVCGLPNIWIRCRQVMDDAGEKTFIIPNIKGLHKTIAYSVERKAGLLTAAELRFLRSEMRLTAADFGRRFARAAATISRWEKGGGAPNAKIDSAIRAMATAELSLDKIPAAKMSKNHKPAKPKSRVHIEMTDHGHYRLAA